MTVVGKPKLPLTIFAIIGLIAGILLKLLIICDIINYDVNRSMIEMNSTNPVVTLRAQAEEFDFGKLRAGKDNAEANSGEQMYKDINRMDFVINGKSIDQNLLINYMQNTLA